MSHIITKVCNRCRNEKPVEEFYARKASPDGRQGACKQCQLIQVRVDRESGKAAERDRRSYRRNRDKRLAEQVAAKWKRKATLVAEHGGKCQECGYDKSLAALSFHHRDRATKLFSVGEMMGQYGIERLRAEALKCDLLCANCHMELEFPDRLAA